MMHLVTLRREAGDMDQFLTVGLLFSVLLGGPICMAWVFRRHRIALQSRRPAPSALFGITNLKLSVESRQTQVASQPASHLAMGPSSTQPHVAQVIDLPTWRQNRRMGS